MPFIYTPHWWRKHGITVWGTVVEAGFPKSQEVEMWNRSTVPEQEWWEEQNRPEQPAGPSVVETTNVVNVSGEGTEAVLEKLAALRDQGVMTEAQYEQAARQLSGADAPPGSV